MDFFLIYTASDIELVFLYSSLSVYYAILADW